MPARLSLSRRLAQKAIAQRAIATTLTLPTAIPVCSGASAKVAAASAILPTELPVPRSEPNARITGRMTALIRITQSTRATGHGRLEIGEKTTSVGNG